MTAALIVAAGSGERLAADRPKALVELAGRPLLEWSVLALRAAGGIERVVVALPPGVSGPADVLEQPGVSAVEGGPVRSDSVRRALAASGSEELVLVHDAARPLVSAGLAERVIDALVSDAGASAAIAAVPLADTLKRVGERGVVRETLSRSELWAVQTPQVFRREALERALAVSDEMLAAATDDAWLVEQAGGRVIVVESSPENLKVTTPLDLELAALLIARRADPA
jgi:2-C-methyl-D-erythritol 4-phosphate cytidylyltransferase